MLPDNAQKQPASTSSVTAGTVPKTSPKPCNWDSESAVRTTEQGTLTVPLATTFFLDTQHDVLLVRLNTIHGRMAARMFAYSIEATDPEGAREVLDTVGREG